MTTKKKDYKYFSFPNNLTPLEQYFYYLKEFGIIGQAPEHLIIKTFRASIKDYLSKLIDDQCLTVVISNLYFDHIDQINKKHPHIGWLMQFTSEISWDKQNNPKRYQRTRTHLSCFLSNEKKFKEWYKKEIAPHQRRPPQNS